MDIVGVGKEVFQEDSATRLAERDGIVSHYAM